jgi:apolipoprotein N-acyltransferase
LRLVSTFSIGYVIIYGLVKLSSYNPPVGESIPVLIIQPNLDQKIRLNKENSEYVLQKMIQLTLQGIQTSATKPKIIIWPETAITQMIYKDVKVFSQIQNKIYGNIPSREKNPQKEIRSAKAECTRMHMSTRAPARRIGDLFAAWYNNIISDSSEFLEEYSIIGNVSEKYRNTHECSDTESTYKKTDPKELKNKSYYIVFGADRMRSNNRKYEWYNSMIILSKHKTEYIYDKNRLLPFGEYIPLRFIFPKFFNQILGSTDCTPGETVNSILLDKIPSFMPQICSEFMYKKRRIGAKWILQILNDGWFAAPILWQHLAIDRLRTIEAGIPLVRVANTGISCVINPCGVVTEQISADKQESRLILLKT